MLIYSPVFILTSRRRRSKLFGEQLLIFHALHRRVEEQEKDKRDSAREKASDGSESSDHLPCLQNGSRTRPGPSQLDSLLFSVLHAHQPHEESLRIHRVLLTHTAICRFSEPIAFNSILAYTYVMVKDLNDGDDTDASFYAGLLVSAYAVAEAITAMGWGMLSDRYGRKPVVLIGLGGVAISSLIFGLASKYWVALLARFVGGALNGNVSVMQTMVAEMVKNPEHERTLLALINLALLLC